MKFSLSILVLSAVFAAARADDAALRTGVFDPPRLAPDFALEGSNGSAVKLSRYRGKVVALGFGYTFCPDVCPTTLMDLALARKKLGSSANDFQVIYVTVDPERDTAGQLRKYLDAFDPSFIGVTGSETTLQDVRKRYGITVSEKKYLGKSSAYILHHSSYVYLIDRAGRLRAMKPFGADMDDVVHDIKALLTE